MSYLFTDESVAYRGHHTLPRKVLLTLSTALANNCLCYSSLQARLVTCSYCYFCSFYFSKYSRRVIMEAIGHMKHSLYYEIFTIQEAFSCVIIIFFPPNIRDWTEGMADILCHWAPACNCCFFCFNFKLIVWDWPVEVWCQPSLVLPLHYHCSPGLVNT